MIYCVFGHLQRAFAPWNTHILSPALSLSPSTAVVNLGNVSVTLSHLEGIQGGSLFLSPSPSRIQPSLSTYLPSYLTYLSPSSRSCALATPLSFGHQIYCVLLASWAHQSTWQVLVGVLLTGRQTIKTKFLDKLNTEREKCVGLWIIKPSKAIFLDWQDKCKFSEKAGFNTFHYLDTFYLLLRRQRRPPWAEWRGEPSVVINNRSVWGGWCRLCGMCLRGEGQRPSVSAALKIWCH